MVISGRDLISALRTKFAAVPVFPLVQRTDAWIMYGSWSWCTHEGDFNILNNIDNVCNQNC